MVESRIDSVTTYGPYGNLLVQTGSSGTIYGFTGEEYDSAANLLYLRARYFNPSLKIFMSVDPYSGSSTVPASQHPYAYAHNNPINFTDPSGECIFLFGLDTLACGAVVVTGIAVGTIGYYVGQYLVDNPPQINFNLPPIEEIAPEIRWLRLYNEVCTTVVTNMANNISQEDTRTETETSTTPRMDPIVPPRFDDNGKKKVLTVGDGNFEYSVNLAKNNRNWQIIGTNFGNGSNISVPTLPRFATDLPSNLTLYTNVDARELENNATIRNMRYYDAVVFNAPRVEGGWMKEAGDLVDAVLESALNVLKPGGEMRFSGTKGMPAFPRLNQRMLPGEGPPGYGNRYIMPYYADPFFGVFYQPMNARGNPLRTVDLNETSWYIFIK